MTAPLAEPPTEDHRTQQQDRNLVRTGRERKRLLGVLGLPGEFRDQIAEAVRIVANIRTLWRIRATDILGRLLMTGLDAGCGPNVKAATSHGRRRR